MAKPLPSDVFRLGDALTPEEKLVLLALIDYGARIYPSQGTLAVKTGYCVRTIRNVVASLRRKGLIKTTQRGAKALTYTVVAPSDEARGAASDRHAVQRYEAPRAAQCGMPCSGILTSQGTSQPNQAPATAGSGWGIASQELWQRIVARDPHAPMDLPGQVRITAKVLGQYGLSPTEASTAWAILVRVWAHTGNRPYDTVTRVLDKSLDGAKDVASVVLHRIKAVAA